MAKLKVLKTGETNINSTDIWRFVLHSDYPTFKIASSGSQSFTIPAGSDSASHVVTHSLGYAPIYLANVLRGSVAHQVPADMITEIEVATGGGSSSYIRYFTRATTTTLTIGAYTADGANVDANETFTAYWIINLDQF